MKHSPHTWFYLPRHQHSWSLGLWGLGFMGLRYRGVGFRVLELGVVGLGLAILDLKGFCGEGRVSASAAEVKEIQA